MPGRDQPDPSLILEGKRALKPRHQPSLPEPPVGNSSGISLAKKNVHTRTTSADEDTTSRPATKKQKQKEKQAKISEFTTAIQNPAPAVESPQVSTPPENTPAGVPPEQVTPPTRTLALKNQHRLKFSGRPETDCAADHPYLRSSDSLTWTIRKPFSARSRTLCSPSSEVSESLRSLVITPSARARELGFLRARMNSMEKSFSN